MLRLSVRRCALLGALLLAVGASPASAGSSGSHAFRVPLGWPKTVLIPSIGVNASIESLSLTGPEDAHAPEKWGDVAWFKHGPRPGEVGHAAMFGHLDSTCCPAVFWRLSVLKAGDTIKVGYRSGTPVSFRVMWQNVYPNGGLPMSWLFGHASQRGLVLLTCAGIFQHNGIGYDHKRVLYARVILPNGHLG